MRRTSVAVVTADERALTAEIAAARAELDALKESIDPVRAASEAGAPAVVVDRARHVEDALYVAKVHNRKVALQLAPIGRRLNAKLAPFLASDRDAIYVPVLPPATVPALRYASRARDAADAARSVALILERGRPRVPPPVIDPVTAPIACHAPPLPRSGHLARAA